jgi:hypothetical protein
MKIYFQQKFSIKNPYAYAGFTAKVFYKALSIQQICLQQQIGAEASYLIIENFVQ